MSVRAMKPRQRLKLRVAFIASEVVPFAKTGGLADVAGSLPPALAGLGIDVRTVMPKYRQVIAEHNTIQIGKDLAVDFIEYRKYFDREALYGDRFGDYPDNLERFTYFCKSVLTHLKTIDFKPDIIHCNDWQSALIPVYLKTTFKDDPFFARTRSMLTIHNLAYQGLFDKGLFPTLGLDGRYFGIDGLEFYDKINLLKGGILFADGITTVSPSYAQEIQTKEFGCGLEGVLRTRANDLEGVINGIDYRVWDPATDTHIARQFTVRTLSDKGFNKVDLQRTAALKVDRQIPVFGIISRLADQKGLDLISAIVTDLLKKDIQLVILGTGEDKYHLLYEKMAKLNPGKVSINLRFDATLAKKIYAGCDFFLMPSRYEPCGLGQMISMRYGTIPIVRLTGGLRDTVSDAGDDGSRGNGFTFTAYEAPALRDAVMRALAAFKNKKVWRKLQVRAMSCDFSWERSALRYAELYAKLLRKRC